MAVYKATYCYPLLNSLDVRICTHADEVYPCEWFTCQIDSSNKRVTGYKIRLLDGLNNQLFPVNSDGDISPIDELQGVFVDQVDEYINSGWNGSTLKIPFFQTKEEKRLVSANAIYYKPKYMAQYVIQTTGTGAENINNWDYDSSTQKLLYSGWDGILNGELVLKNEIILSLDTNNKGGLWEVQYDGSLERYVDHEGNDIDYNALTNQYIVVTHGKYHDYVYQNNNGVFSVYSTPILKDHAGDLWVDLNDNPIDLHMDGETYKWEITLYQGEGEITTNAQGAKIISYTNLNYEWFDTILTSGTILGSTNKRIQVASSTGDDAILPEGSLNSPLVLQGTYIQLYAANGQAIGKRAYVETYDASYGHVYPINNSFTLQDIDSAAYVAFFKHSNDPEAILASDRVAVATAGTPLSLWIQTNNYSKDEAIEDETTFESELANKGSLFVKNGDDYIETTTYTSGTVYYYISSVHHEAVNPNVDVLDGYTLQDGDLVLVKDQVKAYENGIYIYHPDSAWLRSGSYKNWGNMIGAIIYVTNGAVNGGQNFESSAQTFGTLYNPPLSTGNSPLFFLLERPIPLFSSKYKTSVQYMIESGIGGGTSGTVDNLICDGFTPRVGDRILQQGKVVEITSITTHGSTITYSWVLKDNLPVGELVYIQYGAVYGNETIRRGNPNVIVYDVVQAAIQKNDVTHTYISPYINLSTDMALKFKNHKTIIYADNEEDYWIRFSKINKVLWRVEHKELQEPLLSASANETDIPYTYDLRTYFKTSDENPFYVYEAPYLKLGSETEGYTNIITYEPYEVLNNETLQDYLVLVTGGGEEPYMVQTANLTGITQRYVTLQGYYYQFQQASWEYYRWMLLDYEGNIIQDTGLKYDKQMKVTFYGLSNNAINHGNHYFAVLTVVDSIGNNLSFTAELLVDVDSITQSWVDFVATYDCDTHSVLLAYQDNVYVGPTEPMLNTNNKDGLVTPDGSTYYISNGIMNLSDNALYDIPFPDNINSMYEGNELSQIVADGITYKHYFVKEPDGAIQTELEQDKQTLTITGDEAFFQTEVELSDNYCGNIAHLYLEGPLYDSSLDLFVSLPDNFTGEEQVTDNLLFDRNEFWLSINVDGNLRIGRSTNIQAFELSNAYGFFFRSANDTIDNSQEYHYFNASNEKVFYKPQLTAGNKVRGYENSVTPIGNCCLFASLDPNNYDPDNLWTENTFWFENYGTLNYRRGQGGANNAYNPDINVDYSSGVNVQVDPNTPSWPASVDESQAFWAEETTDFPAKFESFKPITRHPGKLDGIPWVITIKIPSIESFYQYANSSQTSLTYNLVSADTCTVEADGNVLATLIIANRNN